MEQDALFPEWREDLFREALGKKHEAMGRVEEHTEASWSKCADDALIYVAQRRPEFTADPIWTLLDHWGVSKPHERKALGPVMLRAVKNGICVSIPGRMVPSVLPQRHRRPIQVYRSLIYKGPRAVPLS